MALAVDSLIYRNMKNTSLFVPDDNPKNMPVKIKLSEKETLVGWYSNPGPWQNSIIIFTTKSIYVIDNSNEICIPIDEIIDYEMPVSESNLTGVRVLITDGFRFVRIAGSHGPSGKHKDVYNFIMILNVLTNLKKKKNCG